MMTTFNNGQQVRPALLPQKVMAPQLATFFLYFEPITHSVAVHFKFLMFRNEGSLPLDKTQFNLV